MHKGILSLKTSAILSRNQRPFSSFMNIIFNPEKLSKAFYFLIFNPGQLSGTPLSETTLKAFYLKQHKNDILNSFCNMNATFFSFGPNNKTRL